VTLPATAVRENIQEVALLRPPAPGSRGLAMLKSDEQVALYAAERALGLPTGTARRMLTPDAVKAAAAKE
jgi:hypothetical protein